MTPEELLRELREPEHWQGLRTPRSGRSIRPAALRARVLPTVAALVIAALAVTGIEVGFASLHRAAPPASSSDAPSYGGLPRPAAPQAFTGVVPGATRTYDATHLPPACTLAQLQTDSPQGGGGAAGTYVLAFFVRNAGADCTVTGGFVRVGGRLLSYDSPSAGSRTVLPAASVSSVFLGAPEVCDPQTGSGTNVVSTKLTQSIALVVGGSQRVLSARFPETLCRPPGISSFGLDQYDAVFPSSTRGLAVTVDDAVPDRSGPYQYVIGLKNTGKSALTLASCPNATEVVGDQVRSLDLRCTIGATLQVDQQVSLPVSTTVRNKDDEIQVFLSGGSATSSSSTTCVLSRLTVSESDADGENTANFIQPIRIVNSGPECTVPVTAFMFVGHSAAAPSGEPSTITVPTGVSTVLVQAPVECPDGSSNIGPSQKPLALMLGGQDADGLDAPFPTLSCGGLVAYRVK